MRTFLLGNKFIDLLLLQTWWSTFWYGPAGGGAGHWCHGEGLGVGVLGGDGGGGQPVQQHLHNTLYR